MSGEATASEDHRFSEWGKSGDGREWRDQVSGTVPLFTSEFEISLKDGNASIRVGNPKESLLRYERVGRSVDDRSRGDGQRHLTTTSLNKIEKVFMFLPPLNPSYWNSAATYRMASSGPGVLVFSCEGKSRADTQPSTPEITHHSRVILYPVYDDLEVEVTIEGYAKWRPEGSIEKPTQPGNSLVARATLKSKTGRVKDLPKVKRFKFELLDTSREPGVCLNWPLGAKDQDFDLRLAAESGGQLSDADQKLKIADPPKDDQERPYAEARIDSYDFGGRATLEVVCELEDGREIIGLMKGEGGGQDLVRIPKMTGPDWIAESWRKEKKVENLADDDDNEKVEGQKDNGDGFTLYEEYRGWVENGKHIEGDPLKKDFFVLNLFKAKADAQNGINLFEALSKLRVHSKLRPSEMSETTRLMNGNHREAPHNKAQHGVWVKQFASKSELGDIGADTPMTEKGVAGRPGITKGIGILARNDTDSIFNQPYNLPARDTIFAYDRAIAHELLHSVGVEHHGHSDRGGKVNFFFVPPNVPENKIGRPHYQLFGEVVITVLTEAGHDLAAEKYPLFVAAREIHRKLSEGKLLEYYSRVAQSPQDSEVVKGFVKKYLDDLAADCLTLRGILGVQHDENSGDQDCVMRYYFAKFYEATGNKNTYYLVTPGTERIGIDICHSGAGTGINASSHEPQSRYGDAASDAGNCFGQICPNDAIPPRAVKK